MLPWAKFATTLLPDLVALARELFRRHSGNAEAARIEIRNIHSQKANIEADRRAVDERVRELVRTACEHPSPVVVENTEWCNLCGAFRHHNASLWLLPMGPP